MRKATCFTLVTLGSVAALAGCSSSPTLPALGREAASLPSSPSPSSPSSSSSSSSASSSSSTASSPLTLTLHGDGQSLRLDGAPADAAYAATYALAGFTAMTVTLNRFGELAATCESGGVAAVCTDLPFFSTVAPAAANVTVYDLYGHEVVDLPLGSYDAGISAPALPPLPPSGFDAGGLGGGLGLDAGGCAPQVTASLSGCTLTVSGTTCDCADASCVSGALEACLDVGGAGGNGAAGNGAAGSGAAGNGAAGSGVAGNGVAGSGAAGNGTAGWDAGWPGIGWLQDGGVGTSSCSAADVAAAQQQFCADVDAWLTSHGLSGTLDCAQLGALSFPTTPPPSPAASYHCGDITHDAFVHVLTILATCSPLDYLGWDSSARLQLFEDGDCTGSPLVLDLDGDGVHLGSLEDGVPFDLLGTGAPVRTAWPRAGDALLAIDWDHDGAIDGARELFGNATFGQRYGDGFRALAELDANDDGQIDARDPAWRELVAWRDADHDGKSQPGELASMAEAGVRAIRVTAGRRTGPGSFDEHGNDVSLVGEFVRAGGGTGEVVDAFLRFKPLR
jgi:hypothetical protein